MIDRNHSKKTAVPGLRMLAVLAMLLTTWFSAATSVAAQDGGMSPMDIGAVGPNGHEIGAQFTVTTLDGEYIGSCTLVGHGDEPYPLSCRVDVPRGTTVVVTIDVTTITPGTAPVENPLYFDTTSSPGAASHWGVSFQIEPQDEIASTGQTSDVAIETMENGQSATDVCYVLVDFSNEGCDENGDGKITFQDVPLGTYTVQQTADLGSGRYVEDFTIDVTGNVSSAGWEAFSATIVNSSGASSDTGSSGQTGAVDIALIARDPDTGDLLTGTCYVLVDYSNEGCDENGDGQVTFAAIPYGTYTVHQTQTPAGYPTINDYAITVEPVEGMPGGGSFGVPLGFIVKQAPEQNAPDTRNVSVVLIDMKTHEKVVADGCVELVGASNVGCDDDVPDGQIDFLDVPAGGPYELRFTNLPAGYEVGTVGGPLAVSVDAGPNDPANQMVFVLLDNPNGDAGVERTESAEVVGEDGFTLTLDGVSVSGAADVAPLGTRVQERLIAQDLPDEISGFAEPVGTGIDITLGDGIQPASPLIITFAPEVVADWDFASDSTNDLVPVVFTSKADGAGVELADAQVLADGSVVVTADHLSPFQPALASISGYSDWFGEQVLIAMEVRSERPDCVDQRADDGGWEFSAVPNQLFWPCTEETAGGLEVTFTNNSPEVWLVESDQATPGLPITVSITGATIAAIARQGIDQTTTAPLVPPDGAVRFAANGQEDQIVFDASLNESLTVANAIVSAVSTYVPAKKLEALGRAECFLDIVSTSLTGPVEANGNLTGTIIRCVGSVIGGLGGTLISSVAAIPGAVTAVVDIVVRNLTGRDEFSITLSKLEDVPDEPEGSASSANAWPSDRDDGPPSLYIWLGANMHGFPDWVACDDATTYCLVGYPGQEHLLVQTSGLVVIGTVDDSATDPRQELLALGLPDEIVTQILGQ